LLVGEIGAAEEPSAVRRGRDLVLPRLGKVPARRAVRVDDAFGQKVENSLVPVPRNIGCEEVIEAAVLADDDDDVLDRRRRAYRVGRWRWSALSFGVPAWIVLDCVAP